MMRAVHPHAPPLPQRVDPQHSIVTPGEKLGSIASYQSGAGTHIIDGVIYSTITGLQQTLPTTPPTITVLSPTPPSLVPTPSSLVLARVTKINPRYASLSILTLSSTPLPHPFPAILRQRDLRSFDVDSAEVARSVRPGDVVAARVMSLGDARSYFVTIAEVELGVVEATSAAGGRMRPVSWERMECTVTGMKEYRKVAKLPGIAEAAVKQ